MNRIIYLINPILRGWVNYFRVGNSGRCFNYVKDWVEKKIRRHLMRVRKRHGFGWNRWSTAWLYNTLNLYNDYRIRYCQAWKRCHTDRSHKLLGEVNKKAQFGKSERWVWRGGSWKRTEIIQWRASSRPYLKELNSFMAILIYQKR